MAKKPPNPRELEYWKGIVRKLQKEIRELKKRHRPFKSRKEKIHEEEDYETFEETAPLCPECGKGIITSVKIGNRVLMGCNLCGWRRSEKA